MAKTQMLRVTVSCASHAQRTRLNGSSSRGGIDRVSGHLTTRRQQVPSSQLLELNSALKPHTNLIEELCNF